MTTQELQINIGYTEGMKDANDIIQESSENITKTPELLSFMSKLSDAMYNASVKQHTTCKQIILKYQPKNDKLSNH
jgi:hypothetical protein